MKDEAIRRDPIRRPARSTVAMVTSEHPGADHARFGARDVTIGALAASAVVHVGLVPQHTDQPLLATSFAAAALAAAIVGYLVARRPALGRRLAVALFVGLLVAYPVVHLLTDLHTDVLDLATKALETAGLLAALTLGADEEAPLAPVDVLVGVFVGTLLLSSLGHGHGG
jgi:hypothetical protein